jgi:hypothetical protein
MQTDPISTLIAGVQSTLGLIDTSNPVGARYVRGMNRDIANLRNALADCAVVDRRNRLDDAHATVIDVIAITSGDFDRYVRLFGTDDLPSFR